MAYAERTIVSPEKSRAEIERTLSRYGATSFAYGNTPERAIVMFEACKRRVRFELPLPNWDDKRIKLDTKGYLRSDTARKAAYDQSLRQKWRALYLTIKAKLEAVESQIVTFEQEFGMHMVLPNNRTVYDEVAPRIAAAYESGGMVPMLENF
jgi:hypothetical protein